MNFEQQKEDPTAPKLETLEAGEITQKHAESIWGKSLKCFKDVWINK